MSDATVYIGFTERGEVAHDPVESLGGVARSRCGLVLAGGSWAFPADDVTKQCLRCFPAPTPARWAGQKENTQP